MRKIAVPFLGWLLLSVSLHASSIEVRVDRGGYAAPLTVRLGTPEEGHEPHWVASHDVAGEPARFEGLASGAYIVALAGAAPTERLTMKVNLGSEDERVYRLTVPKRRLSGRVTIGGQALRNVTVTLSHETWNWDARLASDAEGRISAPLWDEGDYLVDLRDGALTAPVKALVTLSGESEARLDLDLPDRRIRGHVVDQAGQPIANARVLLRGRSRGVTPVTPAITNAAGVFDYPALEPGPYTLRLNRDGYLAADELSIEVGADDKVVEKNIVLVSGVTRELDVVDAHDQPIAGALVLVSAGGRVRALANADAKGHVRIATPKDASCAIWVVPDGGSLTALPLARDAKTVARIVVPDATASLDVQTLLSDGTPLSNVNFVLRYNGELAPPDLARMMRRGGNRLSTNADGVAELARIPAGTYELWPYVTDAEADALVASAAPAKAPVSVTVTEGRQTAVVRFEKSH